MQLLGRFWVFFLSHTVPGFQLWFYFHLYMWVCPLGFAPEVALEGLDLPLTGASVEVVQLLGSQGFWQHQVLKEIGILGSWKHGALKVYGSQYWQISSHIFAWRPNLPNREGWQAVVYRLSKSWTLKRPCMHRLKTFFFFFLPVAALSQ